AVLERVAQARGIRIHCDAMRALAQSLAVSVPELVGSLLSLHASVRSAVGQSQMIELVHVRDFLQQSSPAHVPTLRGISARTARYFTLKVSELRSASRARGVVTARDVAMYL